MKYVLVPLSDIDKIERARITLWNESAPDGFDSVNASKILNISQPLYYLTHRKYDIIEKNRFKEWFSKKLKNIIKRNI